MLAHLHVLFAGTTLNWVRRLGGPGLVLLGFADNSVVPLPGSMDVLTIWLAARHRDLEQTAPAGRRAALHVSRAPAWPIEAG